MPDYYKWTQWCFLQLYKHGLAYRKAAPVNWCPSCNTVLANEQVVEGCCERCGTQVTKKHLTQWFFKITDYAEQLLEGLGRIDWPEKTKLMQKNWIGKSQGGEVKFDIVGGGDFTVFTTRADTLFGCTYVAVSYTHLRGIALRRIAARSGPLQNASSFRTPRCLAPRAGACLLPGASHLGRHAYRESVQPPDLCRNAGCFVLRDIRIISKLR